MSHLYLGPDRPFNLPIRKKTLFADDPEKVFPNLGEIFREHKNFRRLFVPVEPAGELADAVRAVSMPETLLGKTCAEIKGGK